ncbi:MAG: cupin [Cellvibrionaceae bacterium]|nr:cupin [Cellvibrionaceae bacterium]|tara:strand:- start:24056 stop:24463 length:408 start_codon:yes stop_codon:yes gene_type:complete
MSFSVFNLEEQFVVVDEQMTMHAEQNRETLYQELDQTYDGFRGCKLISLHRFEADWPTWERHPAGDEMLVLLEGTIELQIKHKQGTSSVVLNSSGDSVVIPKGCWHTGKVSNTVRVLFVTPGEGTENLTREDLPG